MPGKKTILIIALLLVVGALIWHVFSVRDDNRSERAAYQAVVSELDQARGDNQCLRSELNRSAEIITANNSRIAILEERVIRAEASASAAYGILQQNDALLAEARRIAQEDQRILYGILEPGKGKDKQPGKKE